MMGGIAILSFGGMQHIDQRRESHLGASWGPMKLTISVVPFAAALAGRTKVDWRGIGWWRPSLGLVVYAALLHPHSGLTGVSPLPALTDRWRALTPRRAFSGPQFRARPT